MKKVVSFILLLSSIISLAACGKVEINMQEIYDASKTETMLKDHKSILVKNEMDGEVWAETYLTKDYVFEYFPDEEYEFAQYTTDDARYAYSNGEYLRYFYIAPEGVTNDFASERSETFELILGDDIINETIESVSKKDGRITVNSTLSEKYLEEAGLTSCKNEYVLDTKNHELVSSDSDYVFVDGTTISNVINFTYDAEAPEMVETFLKYASQTEDLRNVTVVSNPGTDKEVTDTFRTPKGLTVGFTYGDDYADKVAFYTDSACTEAYDPYMDAESDLVVYIKWAQ